MTDAQLATTLAVVFAIIAVIVIIIMIKAYITFSKEIDEGNPVAQGLGIALLLASLFRSWRNR